MKNYYEKTYNPLGLADKITKNLNRPGIKKEIRNKFSGKVLPKKLNISCITDGIVFINDEDACRVSDSIKTLMHVRRPIVWIIWNNMPDAEFEKISPELLKNVKEIIVIGRSFLKADFVLGRYVPVTEADYIEEALESAFFMAGRGECILFSPVGCAENQKEQLKKEFERAVKNYCE